MKGLILFAHGSSDPRWRAPFERIEETLQEELGSKRVRLAYMEFVQPDLETVTQEFLSGGVTELCLFPLFMSAGGHVSTDIPRLVEQVQVKFPQLTIEVAAPLGEIPEITQLICRVAKRLLG